MSDANFQAGLELFFGTKCKTKKVEEVDMQGKLEAAGLLPFFHVDLWPASAAVRELATHMKTRTGFIHVHGLAQVSVLLWRVVLVCWVVARYTGFCRIVVSQS